MEALSGHRRLHGLWADRVDDESVGDDEADEAGEEVEEGGQHRVAEEDSGDEEGQAEVENEPKKEEILVILIRWWHP